MNLRNLALLAATSLSCLATAAMARSQPVVISEFMAKNDLTLEDEDGDSPDWIELCNIATSVIDLDGWSLTDDQDELDKWIFPHSSWSRGSSSVAHPQGCMRGSSHQDNPSADVEPSTTSPLGVASDALRSGQEPPITMAGRSIIPKMSLAAADSGCSSTRLFRWQPDGAPSAG